MTGHDLDWLVAERPAVAAPDAIATRRARRDLLAHIAGTPAAAPAAVRPVRHRRRRGLLLSSAAVLAAAAAAAVALVPSGGHGRLAVDEAAAAPLVRLSQQALALPAPAGDATLVRRVSSYPDGGPVAVYDLYADDGTYYFGATRAAVRRAVRNHQTEYGTLRKMLAVALAAPHLSADVARRRFVAAGGVKRSPDAQAAPATGATAKQAAEKQLGAKHPEETFTVAELDDNFIWGSAMDVLEAGAGRPQIRAGVLKLLATIPSVTVTKGTMDGRATLVLRCTDFPGHYVETLVVDAGTGVPIRFVGGGEGLAPSVVVTYHPTRTTLAHQGAK